METAPLGFLIRHDLGKASGGLFNLELDLHHLEVHFGGYPNFSPDGATLVGTIPATSGNITGRVPVVGSFQVDSVAPGYVRVVAVDRAGNRSNPSEATACTPRLLKDEYIDSLTVSKLTAGTLTADTILGASIRTGTTGARTELNSDGVEIYSANGQAVARLGELPGTGLPYEIVEDFEDDSYNVAISGTWVRAFQFDEPVHGGGWSFRSAVIGHSATTDAVVTVPAGATSMTVWWKVSSEDGFDFFRILRDGVQEFQASGEAGWTERTVDVTGVSQVTFRYVKDSNVVAGRDAAYIDDLTFTAPQPGTGRVGLEILDEAGAIKVLAGELRDGDYGLAVVNDSDQLTKLSDFIFGPQAAYDGGVGNRDFDVHGVGYGDLAGASVGPTVDVMIGETGRCLMIVGSEITWDSSAFAADGEGGGRMSIQLSGANTRAASDAWSFYYSETWAIGGGGTMSRHGAANGSRMHFLTGLSPGLTTFTAKYRAVYGANSAPAIFKDRSLIVFPY